MLKLLNLELRDIKSRHSKTERLTKRFKYKKTTNSLYEKKL